MRRVEEDDEWSLMCPSQCPGLSECWGEEFDQLYARYERVGGWVMTCVCLCVNIKSS